MPPIAFAAPLLPGKTETDRLAMQSCWHGDVHGLSLEEGFPPPEQILSLDADDA